MEYWGDGLPYLVEPTTGNMENFDRGLPETDLEFVGERSSLAIYKITVVFTSKIDIADVTNLSYVGIYDSVLL